MIQPDQKYWSLNRQNQIKEYKEKLQRNIYDNITDRYFVSLHWILNSNEYNDSDTM